VRDTVERLAELRRPFIVGVRHHSPVIAAAMPALLDAAAPDVVYLELAEELQPWLEWLGHPDLVAPVALAAARRDGRGLVFYPYADFSPELAALRWAVLAGVPARAFDLPVARSMDEPGRRHGLRLTDDEGGLRRLQRAYGVEDSEELWDRMIEAPGAGQEPEAVRRAALAFGWALRSAEEVDEVDLRREAWMRDRLRREGFVRPAAVVGTTVPISLVSPGQVWGDRVNALDLRFAKILRFGRTRYNVGVDLINATNSGAILTYNQTFNAAITTGSQAWLAPTSVLTPRFVKVSAQIDF